MRKVRSYFIQIRILILIPALLLCGMKSATLNPDGQDEYTLKALFIYNFIKHIEWPPKKDTKDVFIISVLGHSEVTEKLQNILKGRKIFGKTPEVRECSKIEEASSSEILFISIEKSSALSLAIEKYSGKGVLIITEDKNMASKGAYINIIESNHHMQFELNEVALRKEGFKVSNQLHELANVIID